MRITLLFCLAAAAIFSPACEHKKAPAVPQEQDFSCIKLFEENGLGLGLHGSCTTSNDWEQISLSADEQALLNFSDTVSLDGTGASNVTHFAAFPCPVTIDEAFSVYVSRDLPDQPVKLKIAIVDESLNVVWQLAVKITNGLQLHVDPAKFESGKYYRMYYRVSAYGAPSLYEGYGNFLVCKTHINGVNTTIESDCM